MCGFIDFSLFRHEEAFSTGVESKLIVFVHQKSCVHKLQTMMKCDVHNLLIAELEKDHERKARASPMKWKND